MGSADRKEEQRLRVRASYPVLDTAAETSFDEITRLAATLFETSHAAINLIEDRQRSSASPVSITPRDVPHDQALCAHVVARKTVIDVPDARRDPRFADSPPVRDAGGLRFYAGAPLIASSGRCLGTLCVFDAVPRSPLSPEQRQALQDLARLAVERLEARQTQLQAEIAASVVAATSDAVLAIGRDGVISFWNPAAERMFGYAAQDALGSTLDLILPADLAQAHHSGFARATAGAAPSLLGTTVELRARRAAGDEFPIELSLARWHDDRGDRGGYAAIVRDISSRKALECERDDARLFLDSIVTHLPAMLFVKDGTDRRYLLFNKAGEEIVGVPARAVIGHTDEELFLAGDGYRTRDDSALASPGIETHESAFTRADGRVVTLRTKRIVVQAPAGDRRYILGLSEDVTELRRSERHVLHLAHHDSLTGLLNRTSLVERLETLTKSGAAVAILTIDLDRFKAVNDQFGHLIGDRLLIQAGDRLRGVVEDGDIVARIGGDEFVIVAVGGRSPDRVAMLAEAAVTALSRPYAIDRFVAHIGASIGVVLAPGNGGSVEALRQAADLALYRAKTNGRGSVCFFSNALDEEAGERRMLERDLRVAVERDDIHVVYQPVLCCATGQVTSFEALARWTHPHHGPISPTRFIGVAEESGLIGRLGESVLRQACSAAAAWPDPLKVAVNLSPMQFQSRDLVGVVERALAASGLSARRLQLEVTEGLLIRDVDHAFDVLTALRSLGVQILLDDFGVGFSSLGYFERFPFDKVKIDQSFVRKIATSPAARAIIQAVVGLGRALEMGIVAEGVETSEQMQALIEIGCTHLQGFLFSEPRPEAAFAHILRRGSTVAAQPGDAGMRRFLP